MDRNQRNNGGDEKKKGGKKDEKEPRSDGINYHGKHDFNGRLDRDGRVYCIDCLRAGSGHRGIKNEHKDISSHISKHTPGSAYQHDQDRLSGNEWKCTCSFTSPSWNPFLKHIGDSHGFRGDSSGIKKKRLVSYKYGERTSLELRLQPLEDPKRLQDHGNADDFILFVVPKWCRPSCQGQAAG